MPVSHQQEGACLWICSANSLALKCDVCRHSLSAKILQSQVSLCSQCTQDLGGAEFSPRFLGTGAEYSPCGIFPCGKNPVQTPGTCFNFHSDGGASPLDPLPPSPGPPPPLPPSPLSSSAAENLGFGNFFWLRGKIFSAPSAHATHCLLIVLCVLCVPCLADYHDPTLVVSVFLLPSPTVATCKTQRRNRCAALF